MFGGKKGGKPKDKGHGGQRPGADLANMVRTEEIIVFIRNVLIFLLLSPVVC